MQTLNYVRLHVVNVSHGDAMILEAPDIQGVAQFAVIDTGRPETAYKDRLADYLDALISIRQLGEDDYNLDFACVTHPHEDHFGGLAPLLDRYGTKLQQFWDCGFRTTSKTYNKLLLRVAGIPGLRFMRLASGFEYRLGELCLTALAPSLDLRNRFDTYGVDRNNASIVLKLRFRESVAILAGDAFFDSWGKVVEEYPQTTKITYAKDANPHRSEGSNQLNCQLLKVSHHGSKHGTSLEYLEKMSPRYFMITCADSAWYDKHRASWGNNWPHPLTEAAIREAHKSPEIHTSATNGNVVYHLRGSKFPRVKSFTESPSTTGFEAALAGAI